MARTTTRRRQAPKTRGYATEAQRRRDRNTWLRGRHHDYDGRGYLMEDRSAAHLAATIGDYEQALEDQYRNRRRPWAWKQAKVTGLRPWSTESPGYPVLRMARSRRGPYA